jgi:hypothetical protein
MQQKSTKHSVTNKNKIWRWYDMPLFCISTVQLRYLISSRCSVPGNSKVVAVLSWLSTMPWRRMREWRYSSTIHHFGTRWRWVVSFTCRSLYLLGKKSTRYPLDRRLGGPQRQFRRCKVVKSLLTGIKPRFLGRLTRSIVARTSPWSLNTEAYSYLRCHAMYTSS